MEDEGCNYRCTNGPTHAPGSTMGQGAAYMRRIASCSLCVMLAPPPLPASKPVCMRHMATIRPPHTMAAAPSMLLPAGGW